MAETVLRSMLLEHTMGIWFENGDYGWSSMAADDRARLVDAVLTVVAGLGVDDVAREGGLFEAALTPLRLLAARGGLGPAVTDVEIRVLLQRCCDVVREYSDYRSVVACRRERGA